MDFSCATCCSVTGPHGAARVDMLIKSGQFAAHELAQLETDESGQCERQPQVFKTLVQFDQQDIVSAIRFLIIHLNGKDRLFDQFVDVLGPGPSLFDQALFRESYILTASAERAQQALFEGEVHHDLALAGANLQHVPDGFQGKVLLLFELFDDIQYNQVFIFVIGDPPLHNGRGSGPACCKSE